MNTKPLMDLLLELKKIGSISSLLHWDQETYMPEGSGDSRAEQIAYLSSLAHRLHTNDNFKTELGKLVDLNSGNALDDSADQETRRMLHLAWKEYHDSVALPPDFVNDYTAHSSKSQQVWQKARKNNDFQAFAPYLEKMVEFKKREAEYLGIKTTPYDTLLDPYEPDMTSEKITSLFNELKPRLIQLLVAIKNSRHSVEDEPLKQSFPTNKQWEFGLSISRQMGFDFNCGRQDISAHPFTTNFHPTDVRITTRLTENDFKSALFATIHETGHALYEQGIKPEDYGSTLGEAASTGIHESQSRFWENLVGRSKEFWTYFFPKLKKSFPKPLKDVQLDEFYRMVNKVDSSLIRVEADEVTYSLHIMLRFEIELMLINGNLSVYELPKYWNQKMEEYLGIQPPDNKVGVLQDVHWSMGYFGYFPTYALGNLYSAMIMDRIKNDFPNFEDEIRSGNLFQIREWLKEHIHNKGRRFTAEELILNLTGKPLSATPYIDYLEKKYSEIYRLENLGGK